MDSDGAVDGTADGAAAGVAVVAFGGEDLGEECFVGEAFSGGGLGDWAGLFTDGG